MRRRRISAAVLIPAKETPTKYTSKATYSPQGAPPITPQSRSPVTTRPSRSWRE